jgi:hypothetical protein
MIEATPDEYKHLLFNGKCIDGYKLTFYRDTTTYWFTGEKASIRRSFHLVLLDNGLLMYATDGWYTRNDAVNCCERLDYILLGRGTVHQSVISC